jgi:Peptidase family M48
LHCACVTVTLQLTAARAAGNGTNHLFCQGGATPTWGGARAVGLRGFGLCGYVLGACLACSASISAQNLKSLAADRHSSSAVVAQLRSQLNKSSVPAEEIPGPAAFVFDQLVHEVSARSPGDEMSWELRVVKGLAGNAFSLPDGAIYVDDEMAQLLGNDPGLWAAILAHEIVHVTQRHWIKRAVFQDSLKDARPSWSFMQLSGFPAIVASSTPTDRERELAYFSQDLELEADVGSFVLMARSGFHPDFVTALYHLMEAQEGSSGAAYFLASHPGWDVRESQLRKRYSAAVAEFAKLWPEPANSPGGNPPILAFVGRPEARHGENHNTAEVSLPIQCENSSGKVEVVLLLRQLRTRDVPPSEQTQKMQQTVDCTATRGMASFVLRATRPREEAEVDFYVMDSRGWVLARSPKLKLQY